MNNKDGKTFFVIVGAIILGVFKYGWYRRISIIYGYYKKY